MYLKLLGGAVIETDRGPLAGPAAQRRRLALLARLVVAGDRGVSREKLADLLWPDSNAERSRHLLSDSVYRINQAAGAEAIVPVGDALRLDPAVLPSDLGDFESALAKNDWDSAARLYGGPLLDGVFIEGAAEFDRWLEEERGRLARGWAGAIEALALDAEQKGDRGAAVERWRVLAVHDPYSSRFAMGLVKALAAAGDPAAALRQARVHEALLKSELNAEPPAEFTRVVRALRPGADPAPAPPAGPIERPALANTTAIPAIRPRPAAVDEARTTNVSPPPRPSVWPKVALALVVLAAMVIALILLLKPDRAANPAPTALAVIPFVDLSPGDAQAYFADGITEELINRLAQVEGLRVPSRTSVFALRDRGLDVRELGRRLGVGTVLEGSVRAAGTRFRITAQLTDAHNGYHLWSSTYDREMADVLAIQDEIARAIVATLRERLGARTGDPAGPAAAVDPRAYELYLRGRYHWHRRTQADLERATADFGEATRITPGYARAWAGLADAYAILGFYDFMPPREAFPRAREAAERAFAAAEVQGEAAATRGYVLLYHDWRWAEAEEWFRRAIDLEPQSSKAAQWYGNLLTARGRFDDAEREMRRAQELEPLSLIASAALGWVFYHARRYEDAVAQLDATLALDSTFFLAHLWRGQTWERMGRPDSAIAALRRAAALSDSGTLALSALALAHGTAGDRPVAARLYQELRNRRARGYEAAYELAKAALGAGQRSEALRWLEQAVEDRAHSIAFLAVDPQLDTLRAEPRFEALRRRAGI